jgi:peroxiredoxin
MVGSFTTETAMTIQTGDRLPSATFAVLRNGVQQLTTDDVFKGKKVVLFAVPGAFTPTCSERHLPGYIEHYGDFKKRGIDVACMAVNDAFVMQAWAEHRHVPDDGVVKALQVEAPGEFRVSSAEAMLAAIK